MTTPNFDSFDKAVGSKEKEKAPDFSAFDNHTPTNEANPEDVPYAKSYMAGVVSQPLVPQGASIGKTLMDVLTGITSPSDALDEYRNQRDITSQELQKNREANPKTALLGQLTSGLATAIPLAGGKVANTALDATTKALGQSPGLMNAAETGMIYGGLTGASESPGDLTKGQFGQVANDAIGNLLPGAATGVGMHGVGLGLSAAANTKVGKAFSKGLDKINLWNKGAQSSALDDVSQDLGKNIIFSTNKASNVYEAAKKAIAKSDKTKDIKDVLSPYIEQAQKMQADSVPGHTLYEEGKKIEGILNDYIHGPEQPIQASKFTPQQVEDVPATPSGLAKMQGKLAQIVDNLKDQGVDVKTDIQHVTLENGDKVIRGKYWYDEPVNAPEKVVEPQADPNMGEQPPTPSFKGSFENSPEGLKKAQDALAKLRSKARLSGDNNQYSLLHDPMEGLYHVAENPSNEMLKYEHPMSRPLPPQAEMGNGDASQANSTLDPGNTESKYNTFLKNIYTGDTPGVPASQNITPAVKGPVQELGQARYGADTNYSPTKLIGLKNDLAAEKLGTSTAPGENIFKQSLGDVNNALNETGGESWRAADKQWEAAKNVQEMMGHLDKSDILTNPITGEQTLKPDAFNKVSNAIRQSGAEGTATERTSSYKIKKILEQLRQVDPESTDALAPKIEQAAENYDLSRDINVEKPFHTNPLSHVKGNAIGAANAAGQGLAYTQQTIKKVVSMGANGLNALADKMSPKINSLTQHLPNAWEGMKDIPQGTVEKGAQDVANILREAAQRDDIGRNALIFTLMQSPAYRDTLKKYIEE